MIHCLFAKHQTDEAEIVAKAFERSFTKGQVCVWSGERPDAGHGDIFVAISPDDAEVDFFKALVNRRTKLILLGPISPAFAAFAGISVSLIGSDVENAAQCAPATPYHASESSAAIRYADVGLGRASPLRERRLCRFDFTNEWNNLGYGRIALGNDLWSIGVVAKPTTASVVAELVDGTRSLGAVSTVLDVAASAIFWSARSVGPIDGQDWQVMETFITDYRASDLPCRPSLRDVPHGVGAAVTMRLDCDEDIASSRPLLELYQQRGFPLSVAIKTDQPEHPAHIKLLNDVLSAGGSVLSHSVSHAPNWGGDAAAAENEARQSGAWLESRIAGLSVRYAVSPFHKNPRYVPGALAAAGYDGFIGGVIANDPEYLMARGGIAPFGPNGFITHSQSCMMHGDCMLVEGDPIRTYKEAFRTARAASQFFGYLDHPFSSRYTYGWRSEAERMARHADFLDVMQSECDADGTTLLFVNEETCLDFMRDKSATIISFDETLNTYSISRTHAAKLPLSVAFRGDIQAAAYA